MGREAALLLLRKIEHPGHSSAKAVLPTSFLSGSSIAFIEGKI
jgi:DNA-binding LacI/PurR family transcriptional regulator